MRALIVDDSRFVRDFLRGLLEEKGIECEEAADGQAGMDHLHSGMHFDLALVDWNMPVMNGLEMLQPVARRGIRRPEGDDGDHRGGERLYPPRPGCRRRRISDEALRRRGADGKAGHARSGGGLSDGPRPANRILIVDDSAVMRSLLRSVVCADAGLEVAGTAGDGESALSAIETLRPDLVLLDVEMPVMDGLVTLRKLRARGHKMPVIMCSSLTQRGAKVTIEALACGASDYVAKPAGQASREAAMQGAFTGSDSQDSRAHHPASSSSQLLGAARAAAVSCPMAPPPEAQPISSTPAALAIGVSTGGPAALDILLPALPASFPLPV